MRQRRRGLGLLAGLLLGFALGLAGGYAVGLIREPRLAPALSEGR